MSDCHSAQYELEVCVRKSEKFLLLGNQLFFALTVHVWLKL